MVNLNEIGAPAVVETAGTPNHQPSEEVDVISSKRTPSPAFQFYPKDFFSSDKVDRMSMTERGCYITLLGKDWLENGLPTDVAELAAMCRMKPSQFRRMWEHGKLHECFTEKNGRYFNPRLEVERRAQAEFRKRQKEKAEKRWHLDAVAMPSTAPGNALLSASSSASSSVKKESSAEPHGDSTPVVFTFPTAGHPSSWDLHQSRIEMWAGMYPGVDVLAECRKAFAWTEAAPNRKTARGMPAFLVRWLNKAADRPRTVIAPAGCAPVATSLSPAMAARLRERMDS